MRVYYADFWLPDFGVGIEYAGVNNDRGYAAGMARKKTVYESSGIPCVFVRSDDLRGYWPESILRQVRGILRKRLAQFDSLEVRADRRED